MRVFQPIVRALLLVPRYACGLAFGSKSNSKPNSERVIIHLLHFKSDETERPGRRLFGGKTAASGWANQSGLRDCGLSVLVDSVLTVADMPVTVRVLTDSPNEVRALGLQAATVPPSFVQAINERVKRTHLSEVDRGPSEAAALERVRTPLLLTNTCCTRRPAPDPPTAPAT